MSQVDPPKPIVQKPANVRTAVAFALAHGYVLRRSRGLLFRVKGGRIADVMEVSALMALADVLGWERASLVLRITGGVSMELNEPPKPLPHPQA